MVRAAISLKDLAWAEAGWRLNRYGISNCWDWATRNFHPQILRLFIEDVDTDRHTFALIRASENGDTELAEQLLQAGANISGDEGAPIVLASDNGHVETVKLLIRSGANVHARQDLALHRASQHGHAAVVRTLLESGADINTRKACVLRVTAEGGHYKAVTVLLEFNKDTKSYTPALITASQKTHTEIMKLLLEHGADLVGTAWEALLSNSSFAGYFLLQFARQEGFADESRFDEDTRFMLRFWKEYPHVFRDVYHKERALHASLRTDPRRIDWDAEKERWEKEYQKVEKANAGKWQGFWKEVQERMRELGYRRRLARSRSGGIAHH
ncbi:hypothetical protein HDV00_011311 [Rhizophlyctis rosea]|nr:hypothetical protein HDV00_011311 [Rhizophlyctis rosea]